VTPVRMGEMFAASTAGDELVAIGLGSCIGLTMVDRAAHVIGLAHVVLPESGGATGPAGKYADLAVPALFELVRRAGARKERIEVVLAGGARMFALGAGLDIGARNEAAVRAALGTLQLKVRVAETGGNSGRTVRAYVDDGTVNVHKAGGKPVTILGPGAGGAAARTSSGAQVGAQASFGAGRA
jgi:chemotaxis protein CheD